MRRKTNRREILLLITAGVAAAVVLAAGFRLISRMLAAEVPEYAGLTILKEYGYDYETVYEGFLMRFERVYFVFVLLIFAAAFCFVFFVLLRRRKKEKQELSQLISYVKEINCGVYDLKADENEEDDYSRLSNEIYKTMVLLRESRSLEARKNEELRSALEDISHQIKTPLTSVQILTDNILQDPQMPEPVRQDFLRTINRQLDHVSSLVITLLNLAKFDSGTIQMNPRETTAGRLLQQVTDDLAIMAEVSDVRIVSEGDLDAGICLDEKWQCEAIKNIVKNAVEHSPAGSAVRIKASDSALFLKLTVEDEGPGISREDQRHIFERFYRAAGAKEDSAGIGLAFAKAVIEKEDGFVTVDSEPGSGTVFTVKYKKIINCREEDGKNRMEE